MTQSVLIINGPNLNLLGKREPDIYGHETLADIENLAIEFGKTLGQSVKCFQSNSEGDIVSEIHAARDRGEAIIINAGAYTHTSVAIRDALAALDKPVLEVHISNVYKREDFRHHSYISGVATGCVVGCGSTGYKMALLAISEL